MSNILRYKSHAVTPFPGESALDALLRIGADIPFSCKGGSCHSCMVRSSAPAPSAQKGLPPHLVQAGYVLACKLVPAGQVRLEPRRAQDMITRGVLTEASLRDDGTVVLQLEAMHEIKYQRGDKVRIVSPAGAREAEAVLSSDPASDYLISIELTPSEAAHAPPWATAEGIRTGQAVFGLEFDLRGPFPGAGRDDSSAEEMRPPAADPALWAELGDGRIVRQVLEAFYARVYQDERLNHFFAGVTLNRSIDKQYSFLKQCITGQKVYMGDRPRNAHHWMIISDELFDYRQQLMVETLRAHGLTDKQIERWTAYEEVFRPDIVKSSPWPRRMGGVDIDREGFDQETLLVDSVCDYCGGEVLSGTSVMFHRRLGKIGCPACAAGVDPGRAPNTATEPSPP